MASKAVALNAAGTAASTGGSRPARNTATLKLYDAKPAAGGAKLGSSRGHIDFQFNPKELSSPNRRSGSGSRPANAKKAGPPEFNGAEPMQTHPGDVLRRLRHNRRQRRGGRGEVAVLLRSDRQVGRYRLAGRPIGRLHLGQDHQLSSVHHTGQREVHPVLRGRHADSRHLQRVDGRNAGREVQAEPDIGITGGPPDAPDGGRRLAGLRRLQRVRRPHAVAIPGQFQPDRRPAPHPAGQRCVAADGRRTARLGRLSARCPTTSDGFVVRSTGPRWPPTSSRCCSSAYVDDSLRLPDLFVLRFRDSERMVVSKSGVKIGSTMKISVASDAGPTPEALIQGEVTALEAEFDSTGTYTVIRGYDLAHRLFRGRRTETYTQSTASDVAKKVARVRG